MEVDRAEGVTYVSRYHPVSNNGTPYNNRYIYFQYKSPDYEDLSSDQVKYIKNRINQMENALWNYRPSGSATYEEYLDVTNFIDYQIAMELGHNVDAYRLSGKFFKRRDSEDARFKMVVWDMNLAYGNADYYDAWRTDTWMYKSTNSILNSAGDTYLSSRNGGRNTAVATCSRKGSWPWWIRCRASSPRMAPRGAIARHGHAGVSGSGPIIMWPPTMLMRWRGSSNGLLTALPGWTANWTSTQWPSCQVMSTLMER